MKDLCKITFYFNTGLKLEKVIQYNEEIEGNKEATAKDIGDIRNVMNKALSSELGGYVDMYGLSVRMKDVLAVDLELCEDLAEDSRE